MENPEIQHTVLVVEDEALIRMSAIVSLEDAGLCVLEARNSAEALYVLAQHNEISVMVTDVRMPGAMDGLGLVSRVQRDHPIIRTIVVSGNATASQAYMAGAAGFHCQALSWRTSWSARSKTLWRSTRRPSASAA